MNRLKETVLTMFTATTYSFRFCWRNSKKETLVRLLVSIGTTIMLYASIQATGFIINAVQHAINESGQTPPPPTQTHIQTLVWPLVSLVSVLVGTLLLNRWNWFYGQQWRHKLHFANQRELNNHRATLDVARFRSKAYDDLSRQIDELPGGWDTRRQFSDEVFSLFTTLVSFLLFGLSLCWYKPLYALILLIGAVPMVYWSFRNASMWWDLAQKMVPQHKARHVLERSYRHTTAFLQALMFNQMPALRVEIDINVGNILEEHARVRRISFWRGLISHLVGISALGYVVADTVWTTVIGMGAIGTFTVILGSARTFQANLESIVSLVAEQWNSAKGVILIEKEFLGLKPVLQTPYPVVPRFDLTPRLRFVDVSFRYPDTDRLVLKNINFSIRPGSKVAIVGKSGHGKSTIQALLMRHYDPSSGAVYADDINLQNIEPAVWSNVVSALTQEFIVLERRVGAEIASSRLGQTIDPALVSASAQFANFDEVVASDPNGYETQIGTQFGGREFSGGEQQRLALARVHYRGTPILILDEPDAKLDPESAQKIIDRLFAFGGVTIIMITHHVSRAERCDQVIVVEKGEIVEQGSPSDLLALNGFYATMLRKDKERLGITSDSPASE